MDVRRFKCPPGATHRLRSGLPLHLNPLPQFEIDRAEQEARARIVSRGGDPNGEQVDLERAVRTVAASADRSVDLVRQLLPAQVAHLYGCWQQVQESSSPNIGKLTDYVRRSIYPHIDPSLVSDGVAAHACDGAPDFFGKSISQITEGQLAYFMIVRNAFSEIHIENKGKKVSKKWLAGQTKKTE